MYYTLPRVLVQTALLESRLLSMLLVLIQHVLEIAFYNHNCIAIHYITSDASTKSPSTSSNAVKTRINSEKSKYIAVLYILQGVHKVSLQFSKFITKANEKTDNWILL